MFDAVGIDNIQLSVKLKCQVQRKAALDNVLHVPGLKQNLFSVRSAPGRAMVVQFSHCGKLYYLDLESSNHEVNLVACMAPETNSYQSCCYQMYG